MKSFTKNLQNTNALHSLWKQGDRIIIGVSGGRDSMCLLHALHRIAHKEKLQIIVAHVNHGLRGEASVRDQALVESFCLDKAIVCETLVVDRSDQGTSEEDWRLIRRSFFAHVANVHQANSIALGHHQDDHAETLLLHLLRGSGLQGLSNMTFSSRQMLSSSKHTTKKRYYTFIRPLLNVPRIEISAYCRDNGVLYGEDETNADTTFTRNKIRHELIPYLQKHYKQDIVNILARTAHIIGDDYEFLQENIVLPLTHQGDSVIFSKDDFNELSTSSQRFYLIRAIQALSDNGASIGFGVIEEFRKALRSTKSKHCKIQTKDLIFSIKNATVEITLTH